MGKIYKILGKFKGGAIAFSGGRDSLALSLIAKEVFGKDHLCITIKYPYTHRWTVDNAKEMAKRFLLNHKVVELPIPYELRENQPLRCYWCKKKMFQTIKKYLKEDWAVFEGSTKGEEDREGLRAAWEERVISPFLLAEIGERRIKKILKERGVEKIPSETCLLTRLPTWSKVNLELLRRIESLEDFVRQAGIKKVRARYHNKLIRIEVENKDMGKLFRMRKEVSKYAKNLGFNFVTIDLDGYKKSQNNSFLCSGD